MDTKALNARKRARRLAMQAIYQWQLSASDISEIEKQFQEQEDYNKVDKKYFSELIQNIVKNNRELTELLASQADRPVKDIDPVERSILFIGIYELKHRQDIPFKAVLNEAVNLTKKFGALEGYKYVNGILDKAAKKLRAIEIK